LKREAYGFVALPNITAEATAELDEFDETSTPGNSAQVDGGWFHTDVDKEFLASVEAY
jgi:hypothetical protein